MIPARKPCPCHSDVPYGACCGPLHAGEQLPASPAGLMRSRYAAFALGLGPYLIETLAAAHPDRATPYDAHVRELAGLKAVRRFMGLRIVESSEDGDRGEVLFVARLFERGKNVGIVELSRFSREEGRWRYAEGDLTWLRDFTEAELAALSKETFRARLARAR